MKKFIRRNKYYLIGLLFLSGIIYFFSLPDPLFHDPYSTILVDKDGHLLSASISEDGQWRFPHNDSTPEKFKTCIVQFEDEYFYYHPGINPIAIVKSIKRNVGAGKIKTKGPGRRTALMID